ncbi:histidine kinase [Fischerella sp. JS2]|uniref:histidine kinase n=1 Tax=Fischerella sp. JS2 TaxID=2597771 RepID=UPI0028ED94D0|nr:histidine kinase [Fischerella sp. JS2]
MPNNIKEQIRTDLQQAKETGQLRAERIREIVKAAVSQVVSEFQEGSTELRSIVRDAVSVVVENLQTKGSEFKENVTASIEGALEAVNTKRHESIAKTQAQVKQLQSQLDEEENKIQQEVDGILAEIQETNNVNSPETKTAIDSAIDTIKNSDELALLRRRYAQLQAQLAIVKANLAARYGGRSEEVKSYLDDAKNWFQQARPQAEAAVAQVQQKHDQLEAKIGEAGTSLAKKERQIRIILRDLLLSAADWLKEKEPVDKVGK